MSAIDQYKHTLLGFLECPSDDELVFNSPTRLIAIYRLEEDVPSQEKDFDGKVQDILLGGGSGEASAMRFSFPEVLHYLSDEARDNFNRHKAIYQTFWSHTFAYKIGNGCRKLGWNPQEIDLELWLMVHLVAFLFDNYSEQYPTYQFKKESLRFDGKIYKIEKD